MIAGTSGENTGLYRAARTVALAGTIAAAIALIALRIYLVPIFGPSDENDHFDYALSIARAGHLLSAKNPLGFPTADLESSFLETYSDFPRVYLNHGERARRTTPPYGSHQYYRRIDLRSTVELPNPHDYLNAPDHPNPVLVSMYPFAFYAANAVWIDTVARLTSSLSALFFAARWFSAMLVALGLLLAYGIARQLGLGRVYALGFTSIVGCFSLTSFVGAYVQPDDLAFFATNLTLFAALRLRKARGPWDWIAFSAGLALLSVTKYQTALCVALGAGPAVAIGYYLRSRSIGRTLRAALFVAYPAAAAIAVQTVAIGTNAAFERTLGNHFSFNGPGGFMRTLALVPEAVRYYYIGNVQPAMADDYRYASAVSYWNQFDNLDTYVTLGNAWTDAVARGVIVAGTVVVGLAWLVAAAWFARRILGVARRGRTVAALRLSLANVPLNTYVIFTAFMIVFYALTANAWRQSGRNWFPFLVPALLLAVRFAPRALPNRRAAHVFGGAFFALLALYSSAGSYYAAAAVRDRYYGPPALAPLHDFARGPAGDIMVLHVDGDRTDVAPVPIDVVARGGSVEIEGVASDLNAHDAASGVIGLVDGRDEIAASYEYAHQDVSERLHEPAMFWAGYHLTIPTTNLSLGQHRVALYVISKDKRTASPTPRTVNFIVAMPAPVRPLALDGGGRFTGYVEKLLPLESAPPDGTETLPVVLTGNRTLYLQGWLVDVAGKESVHDLDAIVDGRRTLPVHVGMLRPELRAAFPSVPPAVAETAGFSAIVSMRDVAAGTHHLSLVAHDSHGTRRVVLADFPFAIVPGHVASTVEPAPVAMPRSFRKDPDYAGSVDAIAPLDDEEYWNPAAEPTWVPRGEPMVLRGWAVDELDRRPLQPIMVSIDGGPAVSAPAGDARPDVVLGLAPLPERATANSGYHALLPTQSLALGVHYLRVSAIDPRTHEPLILAEHVPFTVY